MASLSTSDSDTDSNASPPTILNRLKPPQKSDLLQKRKNERPKTTDADKKRKSGVPNSTDPKTVSPAARVKEFTGEHIDVRNGKMFCVACREELSVKKSTIKNHHYYGRKHKDARLKLAKKEARERDIADCFVAYDKLEKPAGISDSMAERVYRVKVVEYFLKDGIPLHKEDDLRVLLARGEWSEA